MLEHSGDGRLFLIEHNSKAQHVLFFVHHTLLVMQVYSLIASYLQHNAMYDPPDAERTVEYRLYSLYIKIHQRQNLELFTKPDGKIRFLVATVVFGMRVNAPNIHCSIHWGCSRYW